MGLVHQNLKPSNILLTPASRSNPAFAVKIADFGIAKLTPLFTAPPDAALGSPDFVAPELIHNRHRADHRADLYSLGAVLYFLLTGLPPFPGGTAEEKIRRHLLEEPMRIDRLRPDVHPDVAALIHNLLSKNPQTRPATALEVVNQLDTLFGAISNDICFELPTPTDGNGSYIPGQLSARIRQTQGARSPGRRIPAAATVDFGHAPETASWEQITGRHAALAPAKARAYGSRGAFLPTGMRLSSFLAGMLVVSAAALGVMFKVMAK
jgi:serine/threonine protein kinase